MKFAKENTSVSNLEEEILFHLTELRYHLQSAENAFKEACIDLKEASKHDAEVKALTKKYMEEMCYAL